MKPSSSSSQPLTPLTREQILDKIQAFKAEPPSPSAIEYSYRQAQIRALVRKLERIDNGITVWY